MEKGLIIREAEIEDAERLRHDNVDIFARTSDKTIPHVAADDESADAHFFGRLGYNPENRMIQESFRYCLHIISSHIGAFSIKTNPSPSLAKRNVLGPFVTAI